MSKISVVINTLNEENNIKRAISSVDNIADEVVVVDMNSEDKTVEIAKDLGAKVYLHKRCAYVEPARNYAISKALGDWVLILDADEEIPESLSKKIRKLIQNKADYFRIPRKNMIFGKWIKHSGWWPDYNIRLFRKGHVTWNDEIHSIPLTEGKGEELKAGEENAIVHHHYESIDQYIKRLNRYTSVQAKDLLSKKYDVTWKDFIKKPSEEFFSRFFKGEGYKDGTHGLALSLLQSFSQLVVYLKIWEARKFVDRTIEIRDFNDDISSIQKNLNYWKADSQFNASGGIVNKIKRKFKLP